MACLHTNMLIHYIDMSSSCVLEYFTLVSFYMDPGLINLQLGFLFFSFHEHLNLNGSLMANIFPYRDFYNPLKLNFISTCV